MLVDDPIEIEATNDTELGATLVTDEDDVETEVEADANENDTVLSADETEILAFVRENNLSISTLRQFDAFVNALRAKAVRMNTVLPGASRDFNAMSLSELQAFVADRIALGKNSGLLGHNNRTTDDGADAEEKLTPGELLKGGNN